MTDPQADEEKPPSTPTGPAAGPERVQKVMARLGLGSRRASEEMIVEGRVLVNGVVATLGDRITNDDQLEVDGHRYSHAPNHVVYLLNKPRGVVSTADDPQGRPTVVDAIDAAIRIYPVGRLDIDSEGLILLTNDGDLTFRLTHPSFGVDKEYLVSVEGEPSPGALRRLRNGIELDDGPTAPARVSSVGPGTLKIVIHEGRNRQIRRMLDAVGHPVTRLVRTRIGPLADRRLGPGEWRKLLQDEVLSLQRAVRTGR